MRRFMLTLCPVALICSVVAWQLSKPVINHSPGNVIVDSTVHEEDILEQVLSFNSKEFAPSQNFRKGHVQSTTLKNYLTKTDYGYVAQLSSFTNIPTASVMDGNVYVSGGFGSKQYYSFKATTGELNWAITLDDDGPSVAAIADGMIIFNTESCTIFGCDMITGREKWSYYLGDPLMSMPTAVNGIVFTAYPAPYPSNNNQTNAAGKKISNPTHVLIAIEVATGKILWQKWIDSDIMSAPVAKDDLLYVTTFSGALYKVKQQTGEIIEAKSIRATSAPVFDERNELIVSQRSDKESDSVTRESIVYGLNGNGSKRKVLDRKADYLNKKVQDNAQFKSMASSVDAGNGFTGGAPTTSNYMAAQFNIGYSNVSSLQAFQGSRGIYKDGRLYNTPGDEIVCTDSLGEIKWKYKLGGDLNKQGGFLGTPPLTAGRFLIVATLAGEVLLLNKEDGSVFKQYDIKDPVRYQPVVDNGWIYVTTANGKMHAINTGDASITGWNTWGGNQARTNVTN